MATHSSVLGSRIPQTGEPGGLQSMRCAPDLTALITHSSRRFHKHRGGSQGRNEHVRNFGCSDLLNQQSGRCCIDESTPTSEAAPAAVDLHKWVSCEERRV